MPIFLDPIQFGSAPSFLMLLRMSLGKVLATDGTANERVMTATRTLADVAPQGVLLHDAMVSQAKAP